MARTDKPTGDGRGGERSGEGVRANERELIAQAGYNERVYELVRRIPAGRVMTYGQIADMLGEGYTPRTVGFVMHAAPEGVPWHRVINSQGACSTGRVLLPLNVQQSLLEAEAVLFDARGRCDLKRYRWTPAEARDADNEQRDAQPSLFNS